MGVVEEALLESLILGIAEHSASGLFWLVFIKLNLIARSTVEPAPYAVGGKAFEFILVGLRTLAHTYSSLLHLEVLIPFEGD